MVRLNQEEKSSTLTGHCPLCCTRLLPCATLHQMHDKVQCYNLLFIPRNEELFFCRQLFKHASPKVLDWSFNIIKAKHSLQLFMAATCGYASGGHLNFLKLLHELKLITNVPYASYYAAKYGRVCALEWFAGYKYQLSYALESIATKKCQVKVLEWIQKDTTLDFEKIADTGIQHENLEMIEFALKFHPITFESIALTACAQGKLKVLTWTISNGVNCTHSHMQSAFANYQENIIQFLRNFGIPTDGLCKPSRFYKPLNNDKSDYDIYLQKQKAAQELEESIKGCNLKLLEIAIGSADIIPTANFADEKVGLCILKEVFANNQMKISQFWDEIGFVAISYERKNVLQWALEQATALGCQEDFCTTLVLRKQFKSAKWAYGQGCRWTKKATMSIVDQRDLDMFLWIGKTMPDMIECEVMQAISRGMPDWIFMLGKYVEIKSGSEWHQDFCKRAIENGYECVTKWAIENGCPFNIDECAMIAKESCPKIAKYLIEMCSEYREMFDEQDDALFDFMVGIDEDRFGVEAEEMYE